MSDDTTAEEVINNYIGLKQAYLAYTRGLNRSSTQTTLLGLQNYTSRQFWISYAEMRCPKFETNLAKLLLSIDSQTLNEFLVNGPLFNMPEFSHDFDCKAGDFMKLESDKRCNIG